MALRVLFNASGFGRLYNKPCGARFALPPDYIFELTRDARPALPTLRWVLECKRTRKREARCPGIGASLLPCASARPSSGRFAATLSARVGAPGGARSNLETPAPGKRLRRATMEKRSDDFRRGKRAVLPTMASEAGGGGSNTVRIASFATLAGRAQILARSPQPAGIGLSPGERRGMLGLEQGT